MRSAMYSDWAGEPPGELITTTTALSRSVSNARFSTGSTVSVVRPCLPMPAPPIGPSSRTTATCSARDLANFLPTAASGPAVICPSLVADHHSRFPAGTPALSPGCKRHSRRRLSRVQVRWLSAFLDFPADEFGGEVTFWRAISGSTVSPPRGEHREFASLEPFHGDPHLRVQRVDEGPGGGVHLDIHTDDPHAAAEEAVGLGGDPDPQCRHPPGPPFTGGLRVLPGAVGGRDHPVATDPVARRCHQHHRPVVHRHPGP